MNSLIGASRFIPVSVPQTTLSINSITLPAPARGRPLDMRITAPTHGGSLPIILLSHGHGPSLYIPSKDGYGPLANFYAEQGFVVIQPTHLNSKVAGLAADAPGGPLFWRSRVEDMVMILDRLDEIEAQAPWIAGRLDRDKIAAVGHSLGGQTVGMLLGAGLSDPLDETARDIRLIEPRVKVGVLLAAPGKGGADLSAYAAQHYSALNPDFSRLTTRTLVVCGDADDSPHITVRGPDWHADPYHLSPGADAILTLLGAKHGLGGIAGYDAKETDDEDPDRLEVTRRMTWAYLRSALYDGDPAWDNACQSLATHANAIGTVTRK